MQIAPSILNADFSQLQAELSSISTADRIHLDIMDGQYVPNLTFGANILKGVTWPAPIEAHLMCDNPENLFADFVALGCEAIAFHIENTGLVTAKKHVQTLKAMEVKAGIAVDGFTDVAWLDDEILQMADQIVLMSVKSGFGGQPFMPEVYDKITMLRSRGFVGEIEIDGGVNLTNAPKLKAAGADIVVVGSFLLKNEPMDRVGVIQKFQAISS